MSLHGFVSGDALASRWLATLAAVALAIATISPGWAGPAGPLTWTSTATVKSSNAGWGRMTRLANGDWLAVYNAGTTGKSAWITPSNNVTVESDVRIASGGGDAGLIFRATSLGTGADAMNGYYAGINESGDALVLGRMNGAWTQLASVPLSIAANTWYRLKVVAMGSDIRVYVGDMSNPKIHVTDGAFTSGAVGVRAHFTNASFDLVTATN